jgi:hypothetical protein
MAAALPVLMVAALFESALPRSRASRSFAADESGFDGLIAGSIGILVVVIIVAVVVIPVVVDTVNNTTQLTGSTRTILNVVPVLLATLVIVAIAALLMSQFMGGRGPGGF